MAADGSIRVACQGMLISLSPAGEVLWTRDLAELELAPQDEEDGVGGEDVEGGDPPFEVRLYHSLPCVLSSGETLITLRRTAVLLGPDGREASRLGVPTALDDSGLAPNLDLDERPILTAITGEIFIWDRARLHELDSYGYDVVPVGLYDDGSLAVSGYAGKGFCRVAVDGALMWKADFPEPDLLPTINRAQCAAVGSLNAGRSGFFGPDGDWRGGYDAAATFAEHHDGDWAALSEGRIARLSPAGEVRWVRPLDVEPRWGLYQPLVDAAGTTYALDGPCVVAWAADGRELARLELHGRPGPLFPIAEGLMASVVGVEWVVFG